MVLKADFPQYDDLLCTFSVIDACEGDPAQAHVALTGQDSEALETWDARIGAIDEEPAHEMRLDPSLASVTRSKPAWWLQSVRAWRFTFHEFAW